MDKNKLLEKAGLLPQVSGCYLMKNDKGVVIYVGKAKSLKNRVMSYFNNSLKNKKTEQLVLKISDFDFIITKNEVESLILENNLIKKHRPHYNIKLKDDKSYPYVQVNWNEPFPQLELVRNYHIGNKKELFGPFPQGTNIFQILRILTKTYGLRDCSLKEFKSRKTPCVLYQMKQCSAPCVKYIDEEDYNKNLNFALNIFKGKSKSKKVIEDLIERMNNFAKKEEFEFAKIVRDNISFLKTFLDKTLSQSVENIEDQQNVDVWSYFIGEKYIDLSVYFIRSGMLLGQRNFYFLKADMMEDEDILSKIVQYYAGETELIPELVVFKCEEEVNDVLIKTLNKIGISKVEANSVKYKNLLEMAEEHAKESQRVRNLQKNNSIEGLIELQEILNLPQRPKVLECYDVAIWQGQSPTASKIVFNEGVKDKSKYRYYHLKEREEGNNDFEMLKEAISRRIKEGDFPDVFIVDGGIGQVNAVIEVLENNNIKVPAIGIAKSKTISINKEESFKTEERLVIPFVEESFVLKEKPNLFKLIVSLRDEAHRFSRKLHHKKEKQRTIKSWVDKIPKLSQKSKKKILTSTRSTLQELKSKSEEELEKELNLTKVELSHLLKYFKELN